MLKHLLIPAICGLALGCPSDDGGGSGDVGSSSGSDGGSATMTTTTMTTSPTSTSADGSGSDSSTGEPPGTSSSSSGGGSSSGSSSSSGGLAPGECNEMVGVGCLATEFCDYPDDMCGVGLNGTCQVRPDVCPPVVMPTCGCDGLTHDSPCEVNTAGTDFASAGPCP